MNEIALGPDIVPGASTVATLIDAQVRRDPTALALLAPGRQPMRYGELWAQTARVSSALTAKGFTASTRVAVALPNGPEIAAAFIAVACCAACVPINPGAKPAELRAHLTDARVQAVLLEDGDVGAAFQVAHELGVEVVTVGVDRSHPAGTLQLASDDHALADPLSLTMPHDIALVLQTSGTTARPKIVALPNSSLAASVRSVVRHFALTPADRCLNVRPLFYVNGLVVNVLATLASGGSVVCTPGFEDTAFFDRIAEFLPSWFSGVPTMHQWIVAHGHLYRQKAPTHRFRFVRSGAAPLAPATLQQLEALTSAPVIESYGMTERTPIAINPLPPGIRRPGSVGRPVDVSLILLGADGRRLPESAHDEGEIAIRGEGVIGSYERNGEANTFIDGWLRTGDLGRLDDEGYLYVTGRVKEIINRGGQKISPREIEDAILEHPDVAQAAAFGVPHPTLGEAPAAVVVRRATTSIDSGSLRAFLLHRLAAFKLPSTILFVASLSTGETGKVCKDALRRLVQADNACRIDATLADTNGSTNRGRNIESTVESVFRDVLALQSFSRDESFFALGGDSLSGARVVSRLAQRLGIEVDIATLFLYPSVAELSARLDALLHDESDIVARIANLRDEEVERLLAEWNTDAAASNTAAVGASR